MDAGAGGGGFMQRFNVGHNQWAGCSWSVDLGEAVTRSSDLPQASVPEPLPRRAFAFFPRGCGLAGGGSPRLG